MSLNTGNIYSIPEHPEDLNGENCSELSSSVKEYPVSKVTKKISSTSLPETQNDCPKNDLNHKNLSIPTLITTEVDNQCIDVFTGSKTFNMKNVNRLSVSLIDFSHLGLIGDSETSEIDKGRNTVANMASPQKISEKYSKSYLEVQDCISYSNDEPQYEALLSPNGSIATDSNSVRFTRQKDSENLVFVDLNVDEKKEQGVSHLDGPSVQRPRSRSMQWIQNTFQNVSNKYKYLLEIRRPSDIAEERMRKSQEELEMEESESDLPTEEASTASLGTRRFSENVIGKQKRFPFATRLGHLKDLWKDRSAVSKRQEEKDSDQARSDVCPLFTFPRKRDEDEQILDALRQAMRKCTAVDPTSRPTSTTVLAQLSQLLDER